MRQNTNGSMNGAFYQQPDSRMSSFHANRDESDPTAKMELPEEQDLPDDIDIRAGSNSDAI
jgi:hypothetical protein